MKNILFILLALLPTLVWAEKSESVQTNAYVATGTYTTSAFGGVHVLTGRDEFTKMAFVIGIQLDELPDGMYYEWKLLEANGGDETFQPQPSNDKVCYIGLNGNTDVLRFSVTTRTASGFQGIVAERVFTFLFLPNRL
ncbi:hypothetical protein [Bacteroides timonensis]|uniref:hypothetical protein n=1 Tax=Bacteroides timonensis TaxID=1470345 RepID=UPI0004B26117|nr:hypothetical protein [Bacteroides timonensis]